MGFQTLGRKKMAKYRKRSVVIEAVSVSSALHQAERSRYTMPDWLRYAYDQGKILFLNDSIEISTLEGRMTASKGDMIIRGVQGEIYPCKQDIFTKTYESVDEFEVGPTGNSNPPGDVI